MRNSVKDRGNAQSSCAAHFIESHLDKVRADVIRFAKYVFTSQEWNYKRGLRFKNRIGEGRSSNTSTRTLRLW